MGGLIAQQIVNSGEQKVLGQIQIASSPKFVQAQGWLGIRPEVLDMFTAHINSDHVGLLKRFLAL
jgi:pimeloyl-[acyl-carrier protein] methyl ester esterase